MVQPTDSDRKTCLCKTHENLQFVAGPLFKCGLLSSQRLEELVDASVCNADSKSCAYGECGTCKNDDDKKSITVKKERTITEVEALDEFQEPMVKFRSHLFNIRWQYRAYGEVRENLQSNKCLIHVDFSEN